jgi:RHS repeat-associated protein
LAAKYLYDPYGNLLAMYGSLAGANTYRFSSKEWDGNAGLYYYGYRFYDPNLQRWVNRDPIEEFGGINLYEMVGNDPIDQFDILGHAAGGRRPPHPPAPPPPHKRDCVEEAIECAAEGLIICSIAEKAADRECPGSGKYAFRICSVAWAAHCAKAKEDCDKWNKAHGFN